MSGRTLGECHFLLVSPQGERLHWELAVKCYLCAATAAPGGAERLCRPQFGRSFRSEVLVPGGPINCR
ncbi:MAG: DUF1853 family protein [Burkholderia sp.]